MRKLVAWLGVATLFGLTSSALAQNDVLKPYVVLILDTSGSMLVSTGSGPTSCGKQDNRINHAVCAINNIVNSYGDMVFSLGRFRETTNQNGSPFGACDSNGNQEGNNPAGPTFPTPNGGDQCGTQGAYCGDCDITTGLDRACKYCNVSADCGSGYTCDNGSPSFRHTCFKLCTSNADCSLPGDSCDTFSGVCVNRCSGPDACAQATNRCTGPGICSSSDLNFEVLTPLVDGNNTSAAEFTNGSCNTCAVDGSGALDPEIWGVSRFTFTPLAGTLFGSKRYWQGNQATDTSVIWPSNQPGFDPINRDPSNSVFLPPGAATSCDPSAACTGPTCCVSQCRPYLNILLTDGDETCTAFTTTLTATSSLLSTQPRNDGLAINSIIRFNATSLVTVTTSAAHPFAVGDAVVVSGLPVPSLNSPPGTFFKVLTVPNATTLTYTQAGSNASSTGGTISHYSTGNRYRIATKPIGFGIPPGDPDIEAIAHAGGAVDLPGVNEGYYAADEADLELAISQILADSVRAEACNERDDDCDTRIDEDFPQKGDTCQATRPDGSIAVGVCANSGVLQCSALGTGLECSALPLPGGTDGPQCNGLDDDCDGRVDEGLGCTPCVGTGETCNGLDDDCDGVVDQTCRCNAASTNPGVKCDQVGTDCLGGGAAACVCTPIVRDCANTVPGVGSCPGNQQCIGPGQFSACSGQTPTVEDCDGRDDDCDGICDGFTADCSAFVAPDGPGTDSPGHPNHVFTPPALPGPPIPENICRPGVKTCPQLCNPGNNSFGACSGEVLPCNCAPGDSACLAACVDPCNGLDDDCDNRIDEDFTPADCSNNCGVGQTVCTNGNIVCNSAPTVGDPTCNNVDDDCDGRFDEDWSCASPVAGAPETACAGAVDDDGDFRINDGCPASGAAEAGFDCLDAVDDDIDGLVNDGCPALECPCGAGMVCEGYEKCENGLVACKGDPIGVETCNCLDDNCNNQVDEGTLCPAGSTCTNCQCAFPCTPGEFPCPLGKKCEMSASGNFCVTDPCFDVTCPPVAGNQQTCIPKPGFPNEPQCVDACTQIACTSPNICYGPTGECRPNNCSTFPEMCTAAQACLNGVCVTNPCIDVTCETGKYCVGGACVPSCADVDCPTGQRCDKGACETDPCGAPCPFGQACNDTTGQCIEDPCKFRQCPQGQWCNPNDGQCEDDPCVQNDVTCPNSGEVCRGGSCLDPDDLRPDAAGEAHVTVGGGGGCSTTGDAGSALWLAALAWLGFRRRRRSVVRAGGAL